MMRLHQVPTNMRRPFRAIVAILIFVLAVGFAIAYVPEVGRQCHSRV
jgi:hypothetical protein